MNPEEARLLGSVAAAARELPQGVVAELCDALEKLPADAAPERRAGLPGIIASQRARARALRLLKSWSAAPQVSPGSLAWALRAAADVDEYHRREQSMELVWTGPTPDGTVLRRTDQVLLDLIRTAHNSLYIVTFAAYKIPDLKVAMLAAAQRGVEISLIFESLDSGKTAFAAMEAVGEELKALSKIYVWPPTKRPKNAAGRQGSLHAKCAVADERSLLISSANLTEYALAFNMELGLLVRGGELPRRVADHLRRLIEQDILTPP